MANQECLRYLGADRVETGVGYLSGLEVRTTTGARIGALAGFVVDPPSGRIRYFVIDGGSWLNRKRLILPLCPARVDVDNRALQLELNRDEAAACRSFDAALFPPLSTDEVGGGAADQSSSVH
jgi:sporulation protein YlmC with PRC-barrel domain